MKAKLGWSGYTDGAFSMISSNRGIVNLGKGQSHNIATTHCPIPYGAPAGKTIPAALKDTLDSDFVKLPTLFKAEALNERLSYELPKDLDVAHGGVLTHLSISYSKKISELRW